MTNGPLLSKLINGNKRFVSGVSTNRPAFAQRHRDLAEGQSPDVVVLTCSDSRVVPELIFDSDIGDLFVVRVAGNAADASSLGSLEYAVGVLGCKLLVVLVHQDCGAVKAVIDGYTGSRNLENLVAKVAAAMPMQEFPSEPELSRLHARRTIKQVRDLSSIIDTAARDGKLQVACAVYSLRTGSVEFLD